jgi:arylsulfatase A-like enzyme
VTRRGLVFAVVATLALAGVLAWRSSSRSQSEANSRVEAGGDPKASPTATASATRRPTNVVVILVDTLRADRTSLHGYARDTTPFLRQFAADGMRFDAARSQAACTYPSVNSLLTSRAPQMFIHHRQQHGQGLGPDVPTLAGELKRLGLRTIAVSASPIVRKTPSKFNPTGGFDRGFDVFDETCQFRPGRCVAQRALAALGPSGQRPAPFFLYAHLFDPHHAYRPEIRARGKFATDKGPLRPWVKDGSLKPLKESLYEGGPHVELTAVEKTHVDDLYDEEILAADFAIQDLIRGLGRRRLLKDTLVVVVSDHGEEFFEHGGIFHCQTLFEELVHTPFLMVGPGVSPGSYAGPIANLDLMPTLLEMFGVDLAPLSLDGTSLVPLLDGEGPGRERVFMGQRTMRGVSDGRYKLILDIANLKPLLFDLAEDPREQRDVALDRRPDFRRLYGWLELELTRTEGGVGSKRAIEASEEAQRQLRALGYL